METVNIEVDTTGFIYKNHNKTFVRLVVIMFILIISFQIKQISKKIIA